MKSSSFHNINTFYETEDGQVETVPANVNDLLMTESNTFTGWECWAGVQNITIDNQGDVWRAICRQGEKLGSIFTEFDVATETVTCKKKSCTCAADLHLSKAAPGRSHLLRVEKQKAAEKSFCAVPWVQLSTKTNGMYRTCCLMSNLQGKYKGILSDGQGRMLRAGQDSFADAMNSPEMKDLRLRMLGGRRPAECQTCWDKEDIGLKSKRLVTNKAYNDILTLRSALEATGTDGSFDQPPSYFDLRFGNLCNIKCIMCHPASSSRWYEDYKLLTGNDHFNDGGERIPLKAGPSVYDWHDSDLFWRNLEGNMQNLRQIYLVGGEPLLIERHYDFLELCIQRGVAHNITLEYDTNLTILRDRAVELWQNFKKVLLRVSVEDVGERNDYIRFPSKWKMIESNLQKVNGAGPMIEVSYSITWQFLNALTITDLWAHLGTSTSTRILSNPGFFDVAVLPAPIKRILIERLKKYSAGADPKNKTTPESFIGYLESRMDHDPRLLRSTFAFIDKMDAIRGTSFKDTFPELADLLSKYRTEDQVADAH